MKDEDIDYILKSLAYKEVKEKYAEPHRKFHTFNHVFNLAKNLKMEKVDCSFIYAAIYHDIIYDVNSKTNEDDSAAYFENTCTAHGLDKNLIRILILATKNPFNNYFDKEKYGENFETVQKFIAADLGLVMTECGLNCTLFESINSALQYEKDIFYEYQKFPINVYKEKRIAFLRSFISFLTDLKEDDFDTNSVNITNAEYLISYIENKTYSIGIYPGSFNPFHIGHLNIVQQAEKIFDKVIIAKGENTAKSSKEFLHSSLALDKLHYEVNKYSILLTDYLNSLNLENCNITIIRGLRNSFDVNYESNFRKAINDLNPKLKFCYIFCEKEFEHVSSSLIRSLESFGYDNYKRYLI